MEEGRLWSMYHEIVNLKNENLKANQIFKRLNISKNTYYRYLKMSSDDFSEFVTGFGTRAKKLDEYETFVKGLLEKHSDFSAPQIQDRLKEAFPELKVSDKTVYNFVMAIRVKYKIKKMVSGREYQSVEELPYGFQAQVDFGQGKYIASDGLRKVFFFTMVLSRSRYKFVYFQNRPFKSQDAVLAFEMAFEFYGGIPEEIVFDQDKILLKSENCGDLLLTAEFGRYVTERKFRLRPCRRSDPESKGKIENVVKYVKYNFLKHREAFSCEDLNAMAIAWLARTANGKAHQTTFLIPADEMAEEIKFLKPFMKFEVEESNFYSVRKDNVVVYKGNRYTLPVGTYKNPDTRVALKEENGLLVFRSAEGFEIARHSIPATRGNLVRNINHLRDNTLKIEAAIQEAASWFHNPEIAFEFIEKVRKTNPRYIRDQIRLLKKSLTLHGIEKTSTAIKYCLEKNIFSVVDLISVAEKIILSPAPVDALPESSSLAPVRFLGVEKRPLDIYQAVMVVE